MTKVSIIIPVYNKEKYVAEAVESALAQTHTDTEIICIDDCSTDNSYEELQKLKGKYPQIILLKNEKNKGVIYTRNIAIEHAAGEYILPLDADDMIEPTYVEKAAQILETMPEVGVVYCRYKYIGKRKKFYKIPEFSEDYLLYSSCISSCSMFRKKNFIAIGGFKEYMKNGCEDWELWLTFHENGYKFYLINEVMLYYRQVDEETRTNIQSNNMMTIYKELVNNHLNLYLKSDTLYTRIFRCDYKEYLKHMKYRKLFNFQLSITIILFIILLLKII